MGGLKNISVVLLALFAGTSIAPKLQEVYKVRSHAINNTLKPNTERDTGKFVLASEETFNPILFVLVVAAVVAAMVAAEASIIFKNYWLHGHFNHVSRRHLGCKICKKITDDAIASLKAEMEEERKKHQEEQRLREWKKFMEVYGLPKMYQDPLPLYIEEQRPQKYFSAAEPEPTPPWEVNRPRHDLDYLGFKHLWP